MVEGKLPIISVVSALLLLAAISYATGYFAFVGVEWLGALSLQDVISLSWGSLPPLGMSVAFGAVVLFFQPVKQRPDLKELITSKSGWRKLATLSRLSTIFIASVTFPVWIHPVVRMITPENAMYGVPLVVLTYILLTKTIDYFGFGDKKHYAYMALQLMAVIGFALAVGAGQGAGILLSKETDEVVLRTGKRVCSTVFRPIQAGVIVTEGNGKSSALIRWDNIERVILDSGCKAQPLKGPANV